jgi:tetratricopeptide (TPR) repeat protein
MDAMTDNWHSKQMAIRENCKSVTQYSDEDGQITEVFKMRKGFDQSKWKWTDQEKIARRMARPSRARAGAGGQDAEVLPSESSEEDEDSDYEISATENASIALTNGDYAAAAKGFEAVLATDGNNTAALNNYAGLLLAEQRDLPLAEDMLRRALAIEPDDVGVLVHLGLVLVARKVPSSSIY